MQNVDISLRVTIQGAKSEKVNIAQPTMCTGYLYIFGKLMVSGIHICELYSKHHGQLAVNGHQVHYTVEIS